MVNVVELSWDDEKRLEDELYERFVVLRCDESLPVNEVYRLLDLRYNCAMAKRLRLRFRRDGFSTGVRKSRLRERGDCRNIYEKQGAFVISKYDENKHNQYFGSYHSLEDAVLVRDELVKCGWDKSCLWSIRRRLGV